MVGPCKECHTDADLIDGICIDCIYRLAERGTQISKDDIRRVREEVEKETAGLIPPNMLRFILEAFQASAGDEGAIEEASNEIQRLGGLGMCREMARMAENFRAMSGEIGRGLEETAQSIDEEVRRKVRILSSLPRKGKP
jgi:hypothetical protein